MLNQEQIDEFEENGFLNGGKILSDAEVEELGGELDRLMEIGPDGFSEGVARPVLFRNMSGDDREVWQIVNIWEASAAGPRGRAAAACPHDCACQKTLFVLCTLLARRTRTTSGPQRPGKCLIPPHTAHIC